MKILRLKLKNFIGIEHGLGRSEIEINFPENENYITMLLGGNGSGKSTLMSQLHPFRESFDERKKLILEGKEGLKEIDIKDGDDVYNIRHIYGNKSQSFIKKNGKELNENGGVRTFAEIVQKELNVSSDYFKIGKIGSNTVNFIDLTASERKTFISKFLPDIEDYLEKFKIVKEKFRVLTASIKTINTEVSESSTEEEINARIKMLETALANIETSLEESITAIGGKNALVSGTNLSEIQEKISSQTKIHQEKTDRKNEIGIIGKTFITKYEKNYTLSELREELEKLNNELNELNEKITRKDSERSLYHEKILFIENEILSKEEKIKDYDPTAISTIRENIASITSTNEKLSSSLNEKLTYLGILESEIGNLPEIESNFKKFQNFIVGHFTNLIDGNLLDNVNGELLLSFREKIGKIEGIIANKEVKVRELELNLSALNSNLSKWEILQKRPKNCNDDNCPFIKDALKYKNLKEDIEDCEKSISNEKKELERYTSERESITEAALLYKEYIATFNSFSINENIIFKKIGKFSTVCTSLNDFTAISEEFYNCIEETIETFNSLKENEQSLNILKYREEYLNSIEANVIIIKKEIENHKTELSDLYEKQLNLESELITLQSNQKELKEKIKDFSDFTEGKSEFNSLKTQISELNKEITDLIEKEAAYKTAQQDITELNSKVVGLKSKKLTLSNNLMEENTSLSNIKALKEKIKKLETEYESLKLIKDALDPNKGIPLYFIKSYLEKIKDSTNDLLSIAFNDTFEIDFETDASNFFIKVRVGDSIKNDIKEASQGEIALTTVSISLALIEQSISKYNILCLDEIDGPLDASNRTNFINMLNRQIKKLDVEQVFIISHNNAFDTCPSNMILLNNANIDLDDDAFMKNKTVIFKA